MFLQSPFTSLSDSLFGPSATGRSAGAAVNQFAAASDPYGSLRSGGQNGLARNLFDALSPGGAMAGAQAAAPLRQRLQDAGDNAAWNLQREQANGAFANQAFNLLGGQQLANQQYGRALFAQMPNLMSGLFG